MRANTRRCDELPVTVDDPALVGRTARMRLSDYLKWLGRPIAYYSALARLVGGVKPAVFLCQLLYWRERSGHPDQEIYKSVAEIQEETGLTKEEQRTARRELVARKLLYERHARLEHRLYFRVDLDALDSLAVGVADLPKSGNPTSGSGGAQLGDVGDPVFATPAKPSSYMTETTTETTTEITTTTTPVVVGEGVEWPALPPDHRKRAGEMLTQCPVELQQPVLDEWAAAIKDGKIHRSSPLPYLRSLVTRAAAGTFTPDAGVAVSAKRKGNGVDTAHQARKAAAERAMDERFKQLVAAQMAGKGEA